jgi:hypothetical protein
VPATFGLAAAALLLAAASPGSVQRADGLTPVERKALDIVSVKAAAVPSAGMVVTVTFAGNLQHALGQGNLKRGLVAVILKARPELHLQPAFLATRGGGAIGETLHKTHSANVGVVRDGRRFTFFIGGPGAENVARIEVKSFAAFPPGARTRRVSAAGDVPISFWDEVGKAVADDEYHVAGIPHPETCGAATSRLETLNELLGKAKQRSRQLKELKADLEKAIPELERALTLKSAAQIGATLTGIATSVVAPMAALTGHPGAVATLLGTHLAVLKEIRDLREQRQLIRDLIRSTKLDIRLADAYLEKNQALVDQINRLIGRMEQAVESLCKPPKISEDDTWTHNPPLGKSNVCINVRTDPPAEDADIDVTLQGPGTESSTHNGRLSGRGRGQLIFPITKAGQFTKTIVVYDKNDKEVARTTVTFTVADPPTDGAATTPPCPKPTK